MEMLKGQRSTFFPYFEVINTCDMPMLWSDDELDEFQDNVLKANVQSYKKDFDEEWLFVYDMINKHPEFFEGVDGEIAHLK